MTLQPIDVNLRYFKFKLFDLTEFIARNVYGTGLQRYRD